MAKSRVRVRGRFFVVILGFIGVVALVVLIATITKNNGEIEFGTLGADMEVSAAIIRDETTIMTDQYEKITYDVTEGETVSNDQVIAQVYKRGYQDETMVTLLNLQKQIYTYQLQLLGGAEPAELTELNANLAAVEAQIRSVSRGESELDMLDLEQTLKDLQDQRVELMKSIVTPDTTLTQLYTNLESQQSTVSSWKKDIKNTSGTGIVSFYFDGYEQVLSVNKLSTINSALVKSVVKGGNTANQSSSTSEIPLYRIINNTHWYIAFVTDADDPMRLAAGEEYSVVFTDYSEQQYTATAREGTVSENAVVNILEFNSDIGKLIGVRTVTASISKSAQGLVVPLKAVEIIDGVPGVNISYGDTVLRVEVDILAQNGKKAVIRAKNSSDTLTAGQKYILP
ncbi:MAG TPA: HlyD family efflux transporter periplasmic adaptor subunit [Eubacteriales bacterium]|nr:HlyD family efflux transporter periplasmic adaptor subunit [Eubacteriales bacterium]